MEMIRNKRRYAQVELNDVTFTLDKDNPIPYETSLRGYPSIYLAYSTMPSRAKRETWESWKRWFTQHDGECVVASRNTWQYTIEGYVTDRDTGKRYFARITRDNNRLYAVE
jgi:hypothetical protein